MILRIFLVALLFLAAASRIVIADEFIPYISTPEPEARPPADCAHYYHALCKNWKLGTWLPALIDGFEPWRKHRAAKVAFTDGFVYEGRAPRSPGWARTQGAPQDGTPFVYGKAGPPRGSVVYDRINQVAYYSQGCCSWRSTVLAAHVSPPPVRVIEKRLAHLRTARGAMLGQSPDQIRTLYGNAASHSVPGLTGISMLSYVHMFDRTCGQFQNFGFRNGRLVYIEILGGC